MGTINEDQPCFIQCGRCRYCDGHSEGIILWKHSTQRTEHQRGQSISGVGNGNQSIGDRLSFRTVPGREKVYDAFIQKQGEMIEISECDAFIKGFRLGMELLHAGLLDYDTQLPQISEL